MWLSLSWGPISTHASPERDTIVLLALIQFDDQNGLLFNLLNLIFRARLIQMFSLGLSSMPTTGKQKKARKSRGQEMLSEIENLDIMLGRDHLEREESVNSNLARRPENVNSNVSEDNEENLYLSSREIGPSNNADLGQNSTSTNSSADINRLSSEMNSRISREMDEMMNSVSV